MSFQCATTSKGSAENAVLAEKDAEMEICQTALLTRN